ncbi:MAG TPA: AAA family ATPase [Fluviicoccus sp.]|nr:AAA family ATPase [Fluviicoccus sp.]
MTERLVEAMQDPGLYPHPVSGFRVIETHISRVLLTGPFAYKIKKPVRFPFLDFTTLEARKRFCEEELRLNRRLSGDLYLDVVPIFGSESSPRLDGGGPVIEYAVRMREFPQESLLDRMASAGMLTPALLEGLATVIADFHRQTPAAPPEHAQCHPEALYAPMQQNFRLIRPWLTDADDLQRLDRLEARTREEYARLQPLLARRIAAGCVRECHGDLHLGNVALIDGKPVPFDCIEFNDAFRLIDVASDAAFLVMDLQSRGLDGLAARFLNGWREHSGDDGALAVMRFYQAYRALVRAKVNVLRLGQQPEAAEQAHILAEYRRYAALAESYGTLPPRFLAITHGVSGSGKSHVAQQLVDGWQAPRFRSDVERKRMFGAEEGLYDPAATRRTYERLLALGREALAAGYPAVLDATFLDAAWRQAARRMAEAAGVPFLILDCDPPEAVLRERIERRQAEGRDPSDATVDVMLAQQAAREPLTVAERERAVRIEAEVPADLLSRVRDLISP